MSTDYHIHSNLYMVSFSFQLSEWSPIHWKKDIFSTLTLFVQKLQIENYYHVRSTFLFLLVTAKNCLPESCHGALHWCLLNWIHFIRIIGLTVSLWHSLDGLKGSSWPQFMMVSCLCCCWQCRNRERDYWRNINQLDLAILSCQVTAKYVWSSI